MTKHHCTNNIFFLQYSKNLIKYEFFQLKNYFNLKKITIHSFKPNLKTKKLNKNIFNIISNHYLEISMKVTSVFL